MNKANKQKLDLLKVWKNFEKIQVFRISCILSPNNVVIILCINIVKYYMYSNHKELKNQ